MTEHRSITVSRTIQASQAQVMRAFTHPTLLRDWLCNSASTTVEVNGPFLLGWNQGSAVAGRYLRLNPAGHLELAWQGLGDPGVTKLTIDADEADGATRLTLVHGNLGVGPEWDKLYERWGDDWPAALENLQSVLETGIDLRQARRPRLGIYMEEISAEQAKKLGAEPYQSIIVTGVAEGSGAQKTGLQKNDVLYKLNNVRLRTQSSFEPALRGLKAGDIPRLDYYRDGQKYIAMLELGSFPIPEYPTTAAELAGQFQAKAAESLCALRVHLAGLSDAEAGHIPAEGEWSVKEIAAHLALTERDYQGWVADMVNDTPVEDWLQMRPNVHARVKALVARLQSLDALLDELEASLCETAAMLAGLPESFAAERKHLYRRAAGWALEVTPGHYPDEHKDQIAAAIAAARALQQAQKL